MIFDESSNENNTTEECNVSDENEDENINDVTKMIYTESILSGKIHGSLEDPLSQLFYDISDVISPCLRYIGITPNFVTTVRLLMMLFAFPYFFCNKSYSIAAIIYLTSYFLDCLDGHMSRKYNMDTIFGDYYDHIADTLTFLVTIFFITITLSKDNQWIIILILFGVMISTIQLSCQERYLKLINMDKHSRTLSVFSFMCPESIIDDDDIEKTMDITKLFGIGTFQIFITVMIWNFKYLE